MFQYETFTRPVDSIENQFVQICLNNSQTFPHNRELFERTSCVT